MPIRQPAFPELQSVSQPQVLTIESVFWKSSSAVEQPEHDDAVVGDHVAVARVALVVVAPAEAAKARVPVRLRGADLAHVADHPGDDGVARDQAQRAVEQPLQVPLDEGQRLHGGDDLRAVDGLAVVADAGGAAGQVRRQLRVAGRDHRPAVDKDLRADLLGDDRAVERDGAAARRLDPCGQAEKRGVLRGVAHPAPPQDRAALDDVVEPGVADLRGGQARRIPVVRERADKGEGAADVVVGDDQRLAEPLVHVGAHLAELGEDPLVEPALERAAEVDADHLAEHAGVDAFQVVDGELQASLLVPGAAIVAAREARRKSRRRGLLHRRQRCCRSARPGSGAPPHQPSILFPLAFPKLTFFPGITTLGLRG